MFKKLTALLLSATMILGSSLTVLASDSVSFNKLPQHQPKISSNGWFEGFIDVDNIVNVTVTTTPSHNISDNDIFKMTIDPQALLYKTHTPGFGISKNAVYFGVSENDTFSNKSVSFNIISKSSFPVDATMEVKITKNEEGTQFDFVDAGDIDDDSTIPQLYVGVQGTQDGTTTTTPVSSNGVAKLPELLTATPIVEGSIAEGYDIAAEDNESDVPAGTPFITSPTTGKYVFYKLTPGYVAEETQKVSFNLIASCGGKPSAWDGVRTQAIVTEVTYHILRHSDGPSVKLSADGTITISGLTAEKNVTDYADVVGSDGVSTVVLAADNATFDGSEWSLEDGGTFKFMMTPLWNIWNGKSVSVDVTLTDGTVITSNNVILNVH